MNVRNMALATKMVSVALDNYSGWMYEMVDLVEDFTEYDTQSQIETDLGAASCQIEDWPTDLTDTDLDEINSLAEATYGAACRVLMATILKEVE